jgi:hypothetical protein
MPSTAPAFVTGASIASSLGVRQVVLFALDSADVERRTRARDGEGGAPGYACSGSAGVDGARTLVGVTTESVVHLPTGTGLALGAGQAVVAQVHYDVLYTEKKKIRARIDVEVASTARAAHWLDIRTPSLNLPPNSADAIASAQGVLEAPAKVLAVYPQMRRLGQRMDVFVDLPQAGGRRCAFRQLNWSYDVTREPRVMAESQSYPSGALVTATCHYNTQGRTSVGGGDTSNDEDCAALLYVEE